MEKLTKSDKKTDKFLNIKTTGTRNNKDKHHFRYEATPYSDLYLLFQKVTLNESDHSLIWFGKRTFVFMCTIYLTVIFRIEINLSTYHEAL